jgi:glycosyltransferase involved in cell wall biosynthesis
MKIILIGNYSKDNQESMNRFAKMLYSGYLEFGISAEIWLPDVLFAKWARSTNTGAGKWLSYIDKYVVFPIKLKWRLLSRKYNSKDVRFHICDHSNSIYITHLPIDRTLITCHDVLAIRGAFGFKDAYCPASVTGKILQKWILNNLSKAKALAAVSHFTLDQLLDLLKGERIFTDKWKVIHNGFNGNFWKMSADQSGPLLINAGISIDEPYILHVGSKLPRKNRKLLLDMVVALGDQYKGKICFAGQAIDEEMLDYAISLKLQNRLVQVLKPDHDTLVALYSNCQAFIFPSFSEGFGWPVIEAQACEAPVITSKLEPFIEVGGKGALYADPNNPGDFATAFLKLNDQCIKSGLVQEGHNNCSRFNFREMIKSYIALNSIE